MFKMFLPTVMPHVLANHYAKNSESQKETTQVGSLWTENTMADLVQA